MSTRKRTRAEEDPDGDDDDGSYAAASSSSPPSSASKKRRTAAPDRMPPAAAPPAAAKLTREEQRRIARESLARQEAAEALRLSGAPGVGGRPGSRGASASNRPPPAAAAAAAPAARASAAAASGAAPAAGKLSREEQRRFARESLARQQASIGWLGNPSGTSGGQPNGPSTNRPPPAAAAAAAAGPAANRGPPRPSQGMPATTTSAAPAPPAWPSAASRRNPPAAAGSPAPSRSQGGAPPAARARPAAAAVAPRVTTGRPQQPSTANDAASSIHEDHWREEGADVFHLQGPAVKVAWRPVFVVMTLFAGAAVLFGVSRLRGAGPTIMIAPVAMRWRGLVDMAPAAVTTALSGGPPPCFAPSDDSEPPPQCAQGEGGDEDDDGLWPCPPHSVCRDGEIVACGGDERALLWAPYRAGGRPAPAAVTYCVPSDAALAAIAAVSKVLDRWTWPVNCRRAAKEGGGAPVDGDVVSGQFRLYPFVAVLPEVRDKLDGLVDPVQFADLARGRLSTQWKNDGTGASSLWIGLLPNHKKNLPSWCRASLAIIWFVNCFGGVPRKFVYGYFVPCALFMRDVFLMVYWANPATVLLGVLLPALLVILWWRSAQSRREREAHEADVNLVYAAAVDVLSQTEDPIRCLALRDEVRERLRGGLRGNQFNAAVWPDVQTRLEGDQRITQRMVRGDVALWWAGPRRSS